MREIFTMWKKPKMVVLTALCAALYAGLLIPFKGFILVPGVSEFRPAAALPAVMGLLFGPAGAWGSCIGNLIGDFFGTFSIGSAFGCTGNFLFAYVPYKLWTNLRIIRPEDMAPNLASSNKVVGYVVSAFMGSMACALFIAWGLELLNIVPFAFLGSIIMLNNVIPAVFLGAPLLMFSYPLVKKADLLWTDILDAADIPAPGPRSFFGGILMTLSIVFGWVGGIFFALGVGQTLLRANFANLPKTMGSVHLSFVTSVGSISIVLSSFLQNYREEKNA